MNNFDFRIFVENHGTIYPVLLNNAYEERTLVEKCLEVVGLEGSIAEYECYLMIQHSKECLIKSSNCLRDNDVLQLRKKRGDTSMEGKFDAPVDKVEIRLSKKEIILEDAEESLQFELKKESKHGSPTNKHLLDQSQFDEEIKDEDIISISYTKFSDHYSNEDDDDESNKLSFDIRKSRESLNLAGEDLETECSNCDEEEAQDKDDIEIKEGVTVHIEDLFEKNYEDRETLKEKITFWAAENKMSLNFRSQERVNTNGTKVSKFQCSKKEKLNCPFYLEFRTQIETDKYNLEQYWNIHNHNLDKHHSSNAITPQILDKIKSVRNICSTNEVLTKLINQEFQKTFHTKTIYYQVLKLKQEENGKLNEDAFKLMEILNTDAEDRKSFYDVQTLNNEFKGISFMTQRMIRMANSFSDVLIVDTTHNTNRFNLPLFDIALINNHGKTITCFVGLLPDQKYDSFVWAFQNFKKQIQVYPKVIFSDEDEALRKGIILLMFLKLIAIEKVFPKSSAFLCSWHVQQNLKKKFAFLNRGKEAEKKILYSNIINLPYENYQKDFIDSYNQISASNHLSKDLKVYLKNRFEQRKLWVRAYMKERFCAGICTTSRIESKHKIFKKYLNSSNRLVELFKVFRELEQLEINGFFSN